MRTSYRVIVPPATMPVDVDFVTRHCRLDQDTDTDLLEAYILAATDIVQNYLNQILITTTFRYTWEDALPPVNWPMVIGPSYVLPISLDFIFRHNRHVILQLPRSPIQSVNQITIGRYDFQNNGIPIPPVVLVPNKDYVVDLSVEPCRIAFNTWDVYWNQQYVQVDVTAGFGDDPASLPKPIVIGVAMVAASLYEHRNDEDVAQIGLTKAVENILASYRMYTFDGL